MDALDNPAYCKGIHALDLLASVVSAIEEKNCAVSKPNLNIDHRVSCHRCGNIRKRKVVCIKPACPHIFCGRCAEKMKDDYGQDIFIGGCPVCKELCCCSNKSVYCNRSNHCYRKCPATKTLRQASNNNKRPRDSNYGDEEGNDNELNIGEYKSDNINYLFLVFKLIFMLSRSGSKKFKSNKRFFEYIFRRK